MDSWDIVIAIATVVMMVLTAISAGVAWDAHNKANASATDANKAAKRAQAAADRANELRQQANATSESALTEAGRSNETAERALAIAEKANEHRKGLKEIEQARLDQDATRDRESKTANLRCRSTSGNLGHEQVTWRFEVQNIGPNLAENVTYWVERNGELWEGQSRKHFRSLPADGTQSIGLEIKVRLNPFRSAIETDEYRIVVRYDDRIGTEHTAQFCYRFVGTGNENRIGEPSPEVTECRSE